MKHFLGTDLSKGTLAFGYNLGNPGGYSGIAQTGTQTALIDSADFDAGGNHFASFIS